MFIFVILGSTFIDFHLVRWMDSATSPSKRKGLLAASLVINLGLLFYFKYSNFFIDNVNRLLSLAGAGPVPWLELALPIGISFYTFETVTYVVDVYRKVHKPLDRFWNYQLYIILFPKLIAGPIVRYHELADQITNRLANENVQFKLTGLYRFSLGMAKKVLIANQVGIEADRIIALSPEALSTPVAWVGVLAYTFQIYFDFSGYSDMAIGLSRIMGFKLPENFNSPYTSTSITDFWRRWHITLGAWMRNYLYIPLGGNRVTNSYRLYFNLWVVFLASGLWHGASWNFVIWGAYHGLFLVVERMGLSRLYSALGKWPSAVITFVIVMVGWVFFRAPDLMSASTLIGHMFSFKFNGPVEIDQSLIYALTAASLFSFSPLFGWGQNASNWLYRPERSFSGHLIMSVLCLWLMALSVASIASFGFNPFIYFRF